MPDFLVGIEAYLFTHPIVTLVLTALVLYGGPLLVARVPWLAPVVEWLRAWLTKLPKPVVPEKPDSARPTPFLDALQALAIQAILANRPKLLVKASALLEEYHSADDGGAR